VQSTAKKLNSKLLLALNKLQYIRELKQQAFKACLNAFAQLLHLKKVCKKVQFKKFHLVKQGLYKLKADKQKESNTIEVESLATPVAY
jgi:hypothetical protein